MLKAAFEKQAQEKYSVGDYRLGKLNVQGQRIDIDIVIDRKGKESILFIGWYAKKEELQINTPLGGR